MLREGGKVRTPDRKTTRHVNGHAGAREVQTLLPSALLFPGVKLERTLIENEQQRQGGSGCHLKWTLGEASPVKMPFLVEGPSLHEDTLNSWREHVSWF